MSERKNDPVEQTRAGNGVNPAQAIRRAADWRNKPIISISDGEQVGVVNDIAIDPIHQHVVALVTARGNLLKREIETIAAEEVQVWGRDVILVSHHDVVRKMPDPGVPVGWLYAYDQLAGRTVVSEDGQRVGKIGDVSIDGRGNLVSYELSDVYVKGPLASSKRIYASATHSLGRDVLVVNMAKVDLRGE